MYCKNCGALLADNVKFCESCGSPVELISEAPPAKEADFNKQPAQAASEVSVKAAAVKPDKKKKAKKAKKAKTEKSARSSVKSGSKNPAKVIVPIAAGALLAAGVGGFFLINNRSKSDEARKSYTDLCDMTSLGTESYLYARIMTERILEADVLLTDPDEMNRLFDECVKAWEATDLVTEDMARMADDLSSDSASMKRLNLMANSGSSVINRILYGRPVYARSSDNELSDMMSPDDSIEQCEILAGHISEDSATAIEEVRSLRQVYNGRQTNLTEWSQTVIETSESFTNTVFLSGEVIGGAATQLTNGQPVSIYQISTEPKPGATTISNTDVLVDVGTRSSTFVMSAGNSITISEEMEEHISTTGSTISMSTHTSTSEEVSMSFHSTSFTTWYIVDGVGGYEISRPDKYGDGIFEPPVIEPLGNLEPDPVRRSIVEWIPASGSLDITTRRQVIVGESIEEDETQTRITTRTLDEQIETLEAGVGEITVSMIWGTHDDLDLHVITPNDNRIYYGNRCADGGNLDIDMNASSYDLSDTPIENIYFPSPVNGHYEVYVRDYYDRTSDMSTSYIVRVQIGDDVEEFEGEIDQTGAEDLIIEFDYDDERSSVIPEELTETALVTRLGDMGAGSGDLEVSLMWDTWDDLDLHVITPDGSQVWSGNPYAGGGVLDHDANSGLDWTTEPVENIYFAAPSGGSYFVYIDDYNDRTEGYSTNYFLMITANGETSTYTGTIDGTGSQVSVMDMEYISSCYLDQASYTGHTYSFIDSQMTWSQARDFAEYYGGHLLTVSDADEMAFVRSSFPGTFGWIGLINPGNELFWVTGEPAGFADICPDQPDNYGDYAYYGFLYNDMQWAFTYNNDVEYHFGFYIEWDYELEGSINGVLSSDILNSVLSSLGAGSGDITVSVLWDSEDDLDIHVFTPDSSEIYYNNRQAQGGYLDIDANTVSNMMADPVENVYFSPASNGEYWIYLNDYEDRTEGLTNFIVRVIINGEVTIYSGTIDGSGTTYEIVGFDYEGSSGVNEGTLDQVIDSIEAGTGEITVSMLWNTDDDLDLHLIAPDGSEIYYGNREACGGNLDVDANVGGRTMDNPLENIYFENPQNGLYQVFIKDYSDRSDGPTDYIVRVTVGGQSQTFTGTIDESGTVIDIISFEYGGSQEESGPDESTLDDVLRSLDAGTGQITVSMLWDSDDDLDLHMSTPDGSEIYYGNREACGGNLDVDANVGGRTMENPVENIYFETADAGSYSIWIEDFSDRTDYATNYIVRVSVGEQSQTYSGTIDGSYSTVDIVSFNIG